MGVSIANTTMTMQLRRSTPKLSYHQLGLVLVSLGLLLLLVSLPQAITAWLSAPRMLDHNIHTLLNDNERRAYESAVQIMPQAKTTSALAFAALNRGPAITQKRYMITDTTIAAVKTSPGDPFNWFYLAAAIEPEIFDPPRLVLFDQALTMSMITGPLTRDLILARAIMITKHWPRLSTTLHDHFADQIFDLWASAPKDLRSLYLGLAPEGQRLVFEILDQAPGETIKFNQFIDNPEKMPE